MQWPCYTKVARDACLLLSNIVQMQLSCPTSSGDFGSLATGLSPRLEPSDYHCPLHIWAWQPLPGCNCIHEVRLPAAYSEQSRQGHGPKWLLHGSSVAAGQDAHSHPQHWPCVRRASDSVFLPPATPCQSIISGQLHLDGGPTVQYTGACRMGCSVAVACQYAEACMLTSRIPVMVRHMRRQSTGGAT